MKGRGPGSGNGYGARWDPRSRGRISERTERLDKSPGVEAAEEDDATGVALGAHTLAELLARVRG
jgi:hypothetical protein